MKQVLAGGFLSLVGSIWALAVVFIAGNDLVSGWSTPPGRFLTTVYEMGLTALFAAAVTLVIAGIIIIMIGLFGKDK